MVVVEGGDGDGDQDPVKVWLGHTVVGPGHRQTPRQGGEGCDLDGVKGEMFCPMFDCSCSRCVLTVWFTGA